MGATAIISLAEVRERRQQATFRQQVHARVDHWLDVLEEQMKEPKPTLEQLTRAVWDRRQELMGSLTEALLERRHEGGTGAVQCSLSPVWPRAGGTGSGQPPGGHPGG